MTAKTPSDAPDESTAEMASEISLRACTADDWPAFVETMVTAFGNEMSPAGRASWERIVDPAMLLAAVERAGCVDELTPGAASRADGLFRSDVGPWCLDDF